MLEERQAAPHGISFHQGKKEWTFISIHASCQLHIVRARIFFCIAQKLLLVLGLEIFKQTLACMIKCFSSIKLIRLLETFRGYLLVLNVGAF